MYYLLLFAISIDFNDLSIRTLCFFIIETITFGDRFIRFRVVTLLTLIKTLSVKQIIPYSLIIQPQYTYYYIINTYYIRTLDKRRYILNLDAPQRHNRTTNSRPEIGWKNP